MEFIDYYKILEVSKEADEKEIKNAYRRLARKYHPDVNPNNQEANRKFQQVNEANEVLSDPEKRKKYDRYGKDWRHAEEFERAAGDRGQSRRQTNGDDYGDGFSGGDFSEFFESMFGREAGQGRGRKIRFRGEDYRAELKLPLREAYRTHKQTLTVNGKNIRITVPAGIENGQTIRIKGHGGAGINGGPSGDLYITFSIPNDPVFKRDGNDLYTNQEIDLYTAILGGEIMLDTLKGKVRISVPAETQPGTRVRLKGQGFPVYKKDGAFGDLYVIYSVRIPSNLSPKEKELFSELSKLRT